MTIHCQSLYLSNKTIAIIVPTFLYNTVVEAKSLAIVPTRSAHCAQARGLQVWHFEARFYTILWEI